MAESLDRQVVRSSAWLALSYGGGQVVSLLVAAILAHLLSPAAFGLVSLATIVIVVMTSLQESGLGVALIRARENVERAAASAHLFMIASSIVLGGAVVATAPLLAGLFHEPGLTPVVRVLALLLPLRAVGSVPGALIERELWFSTRAKAELSGIALQAAVAISLAVAGAGVWSIVAGQLAGAGLQSLLFLLLAPFRPSPRRASWPLLRELGRFGRHVTFSNIVLIASGNVDTLFAGRLLTAADVGYYNVAWRISNLPATGLSYILGRAMLPAYSQLQDDLERFRMAFVTNLRRVTLIALPVGLGILIGAEPIVVGLFGEAWRPAVGPLRILAGFGIVRSYAGSTGSVFQAAGRPQLIGLISVWYLAVLTTGLVLLGRALGLEGIALAVLIASIASLVPSYVAVLRILDLPLSRLLSSLARPALCTLPVVATLLAVLVATRDLSGPLSLATLVVAGALVYSATLVSLGRPEIRDIATAFRA